MELFKGKTLVKKDGSTVKAEQVLDGKKVVGIYFSAHWCPPCRMFTPRLADTHRELKSGAIPIEIVFVSSDESSADMLNYMKESHGDWYALEHGDDLAEKLMSQFDVTGIPSLVIVKQNGTVITLNGRSAVEEKGAAAFREWVAAA